MAKIKVLLGILVIALVFGITVFGCDDGSSSSNDDGGQPLPAAIGANALSGKTYYENVSKIVFSINTGSEEKGTYIVEMPEFNYDDGYAKIVNGKYNYVNMQQGSYTWNEDSKTVTLKPEKTAFWEEDGPGPLLNKSAYRSRIQDNLNSYKKEIGEKAFNQVLSKWGYSSISACINDFVNEEFSNKIYSYSFSIDEKALFLEKRLPANKGSNELSGKIYNGIYRSWDINDNEIIIRNENEIYTFTVSGYTYNGGWQGNITGSYAYDSNSKSVFFQPLTIGGKDREAYYMAQTVDRNNYFIDDYAYRASETNWYFSIKQESYHIINKTIGE